MKQKETNPWNLSTFYKYLEFNYKLKTLLFNTNDPGEKNGLRVTKYICGNGSLLSERKKQ